MDYSISNIQPTPEAKHLIHIHCLYPRSWPIEKGCQGRDLKEPSHVQ
jgi:hypothetical protein